VEDNIEETFSLYRLPRQHQVQATNPGIRIFPNAAARLRLIRALAVDMHENWIAATPCLNMEPLAEQKKEALRWMEDAA
jgi:predicted glycoside hydrolase/deacetylase ChbG (UPF0249 family)